MDVYVRNVPDPTTQAYEKKSVPCIGAVSSDAADVYSRGFDHCVCMEQRGSTCGLYALAMILRKKTGKAFLATEADTLPPDIPLARCGGPTLLQVAVQNGWTSIGEMFDPQDIVDLYRRFAPDVPGAACRIVECTEQRPFAVVVREQLDRGGLAMVPFCTGAIRSAHWVVAVGYRTKGGALSNIVMANHGHLDVVEADVLAGCNALIPATPAADCATCVEDQEAEFCEACKTCRFVYDDVRPVEAELRRCLQGRCPDFKPGWTGSAKVSRLRAKLVLFDI